MVLSVCAAVNCAEGWLGIVDFGHEKLDCLRRLLHKSSGYQRLDDSAMQAVKHWQFVPGKIGDQAIASQVIVAIKFYLQQA